MAVNASIRREVMKEFEYNGNKYKIKGNGNNFGIINNYGLTEAEVERLVAENTKSLLDEVAKTGNAITQEIVDKVVAYNENKILKTIFQFKEEIKGEIDDLKKLISSDERYNSTIGIPSVGSVKEIKVSSVNPITGAVEIDFPFLKSNPVTLENYDKNEFEIVGTELKKYTGSKTEIVIPQGVTSIGDCAFKDCSLICVEIPSSVNFIGKIAFGCYLLTSVTIPDSMTSIGENAFEDCSSLTSITIPDSVTSIGEYAFRYCSALTIYCETTEKPSGWDYYWNYSNCPVIWDCKNNDRDEDGYAYSVIDGIRYGLKDGIATVVRQPRNITSAIIPEKVTYKGEEYSVTSIDWGAFNACNSLTSIKIPNSVTSIGYGAFAYCESLTDISFNGTKEQWGAIDKGKDWNYNTGSYTIHCTDGDIKK